MASPCMPADGASATSNVSFTVRLIIFAAAITALRLAYLAWFCPYTLAEDEAHYWEWSRRLGWSYYSKGPGVAWAIAASTWLFGQFGIGLSEFVVRAPAAIAGGVFITAVGGLARDVTGSDRAGFLGAVATLLLPILQFPAMLMTIDMPYFACWGIAAWSGYRAPRARCRPAWLVLGASLGIGFLFKYTIVLLIPGLVLFAILRRRDLHPAASWRWWMAAGAALALLALAPVIIYNAQHDWPTLRHLFGHLGLPGGDSPASASGGRPFSPLWIPEFIAGQILAAGPIIALIALAIGVHLRARSAAGAPGRDYLICCAAPIILFYSAVLFFTRPEANWPAAGYITLIPLAAWLLTRPGPAPAAERARPLLPRALWWTSVATGLILALLTLRLDFLAGTPPVRAATAWAERRGMIEPGRALLPTGRITGADLLAADAQRLADDLRRETGREPFFIGHHYGRASQLAFYLPGHPTVYCTSARVGGGRRTQYDLWPDTSLDHLALLGARPAVIIGGKAHYWSGAFEASREVGMLAGESRNRLAFVATGYRGFPPPPGPQPQHGNTAAAVTEGRP